MPFYHDDYDGFDERDPEPATVTCNRCGVGNLHWRQVTSPDGRSEKPHLFDDRIRRHVCQPSADDFEALA